jgi:hypothetical protein
MRKLRSLLATALPVAPMLAVAGCTSGASATSPPATTPAASPMAGGTGSTSSSPSASASAGRVPACAISQLTITLTREGGAVTGEVGGYLRFANAGRVACQLHGWPQVTAVTASGHTIAALRAIHGTMLGGWQYTSPLPIVRLPPGAAAYAVLAAGDQPAGTSGRCPAVRLLHVTPPARSGHVTLPARLYDHVYLPACTSASRSTEIEVSAVVPLKDLAH